MKIKGLSIIALFALLVVIWINFLDFRIVSSFDSDKINRLIENVCLSYIAGYIFFFLNNYLVEKREKKHIMPYIASNVMSLISNNHTIIHNVTGIRKFDFNWWLTDQEFKDYLSKIVAQQQVTYYFPKEDWIFFLNKRNTATIDTIDKILLSGKHLDEELRNVLLEIRNSSFLRDDADLFSANNHLTWYRYFERVQRLKPYFDNNLKYYYNHKKHIG